MVFKKVANPQGEYVDNQGARWDMLQAHEAWTPQGLNAGWDAHADLEGARVAYGLTHAPAEVA